MTPRRLMTPLLFAAVLAMTQGALAASADTVLLDGHILTADRDFSVRQALAIKDRRILAVGSDDQIRSFVDGQTQVIDLDGKNGHPWIDRQPRAHRARFAPMAPRRTANRRAQSCRGQAAHRGAGEETGKG